MSEPPDLESLARRYLDLWQEYLAAAASDPGAGEAMAAWLTQMGAARDAFLPAMMVGLAPRTDEAAGGEHESGASRPTGAEHGDGGGPRPRTSAAASPPGDGVRDLDELHRRLAGIEERLAGLERCAGDGAKRPRESPRKRPG